MEGVQETALLEVRDLHVHYGAIHALHGISLEVRPGEIVALIGANGAGKSTTLRAISGMLVPSAGSIRLQRVREEITNSRDPEASKRKRALSREARVERIAPASAGAILSPDLEEIAGKKAHTLVSRGLAHAPEGRGIFLNLKVAENLLLGAFLRRDKAAIAADLEEAYALFPLLRERREQIAGTLSGGEQQMLAIARALMSRPRLLLLDEPSLGLAPQIVERIFTILRDVNEDHGTALLLVEQNAAMALQLADRAYVLETGEVAMEGKGAELLAAPEVRRAYLGT